VQYFPLSHADCHTYVRVKYCQATHILLFLALTEISHLMNVDENFFFGKLRAGFTRT